MRRRWVGRVLSLLLICILTANISSGYSVLTHEAIIDSVWAASIKSLLTKRFPAASADQLTEARAYAYGGCIIQDMGYYPFGSHLFSDLTHYVRSGQFVESLMEESQDINEYAFALGALAHYAADDIGHPMGTNVSVPILYPKLRAKYGPFVTYEDDPTAHIQTEFGFDVLQVAKGSYAAIAYHDFIGFKVAKPVLERAFKRTYGIEMKELFLDTDLAIGTYRKSVSQIIPELSRVAWDLKKNEIIKQTPGITREKFLYGLTDKQYEKEWGAKFQKPGLSVRLIGFFLRITPKIGPFKALSFKPPVPETEKLLQRSFELTVNHYRELLAEVKNGRINLENRDLDTGRPAHLGEYRLADQAYAELLHRLAHNKFADVTPDIKADILKFFGDAVALPPPQKDRDRWKRTLAELAELKRA